jgi:uncharacterized RDD family membrane protein YckC
MVAQPEPLVTGDAVVLDVQIAQLPVRAVSAFIDITVIFIAYVLGIVLWAVTLTDLNTAASAAILILFTVLATVGYPVVFETATRGRSLGKMAMGLRVVSDDGGPERFRQALFRGLSGFVEFWILAGGPAVICSMVSSKGKRVGDVFAGTMVISERAPKLSPPPQMPASMAWWASSLQLSGLAPETAERARQFLSRATQLDPGMRDQIAYRVCSEVVAQISPPPPPGTPPQLVLAAVLAERHHRELARLQRFSPVASLAPRATSVAPPPQWAATPVQSTPPPPPPQWGPPPGPGYQQPISPSTSTDSGGFTPPS